MAYSQGALAGLEFCSVCLCSIIEGARAEHELQNPARHGPLAVLVVEVPCDVCGSYLSAHGLVEDAECESARLALVVL